MVKKVFLAAVATLILAGATVTIQAEPGEAKLFSGCWKAAKAESPKDRKERKRTARLAGPTLRPPTSTPSRRDCPSLWKGIRGAPRVPFFYWLVTIEPWVAVAENGPGLPQKKRISPLCLDPDRRNHLADEPLNVCFDGDSEFTTTKTE